jgi:hypothetical protein
VTRHRIDVHADPVDGPPVLDDEGTPVIAPGSHPEHGWGWWLYFPSESGAVDTWHIPTAWARDAATAEAMARHHLTEIGGQGWLT